MSQQKLTMYMVSNVPPLWKKVNEIFDPWLEQDIETPLIAEMLQLEKNESIGKV